MRRLLSILVIVGGLAAPASALSDEAALRSLVGMRAFRLSVVSLSAAMSPDLRSSLWRDVAGGLNAAGFPVVPPEDEKKAAEKLVPKINIRISAFPLAESKQFFVSVFISVFQPAVIESAGVEVEAVTWQTSAARSISVRRGGMPDAEDIMAGILKAEVSEFIQDVLTVNPEIARKAR